MKTDESNIGIWLWLALFIIVNATWIGMDLFLRWSGHEYLTTEFREGLRQPVWGPFLAFMVAGTIAAFLWDMYSTRSS
jgi:hypothetical protein